MHALGVKIHLHCYIYGNRKRSKILYRYCEKLHYYSRKTSRKHLIFQDKPFIVSTRSSKKLFSNLKKDNYPILFEGIHTTNFIDAEELKNRLKIVRTHNIEHEYYLNLAKVENSRFRKYYLYNEAKKLKNYQETLKNADILATISKNDEAYFKQRFDNKIINISAFHPHAHIDSTTGKGDYVLYHGNLEVGENNHAAIFLATKVFHQIPIKLIIAGNTASKELKEIAATMPNVDIKENLPTNEIMNLVKNAHINILPTFQSTGIKLKLLAALYTGRWCIVNEPMVENTGLGHLCIIRNSASEIKNAVLELMNIPFAQENINQRKQLLENEFSNDFNAQKLIEAIF